MSLWLDHRESPHKRVKFAIPFWEFFVVAPFVVGVAIALLYSIASWFRS